MGTLFAITPEEGGFVSILQAVAEGGSENGIF
jgi:hypothetical protein